MHQPIRSIISIILRALFSYLFLTIIMLFTFRPLIESVESVTAATNILVWFIVVSCVWAVHEKRRRRWFVISMAATAILLDLLDFLLRSTVTLWASKIVIFAFLGYAVVSILFYLARQKEVTADMLMAGASEYMLIGILWSWLYFLVETVHPGSFNIAGTKTDQFGFLYFSFVTLTTTGYGGRPAIIGSGAIPRHTGADNGTTLHCHYRGAARESLYCRWQAAMSRRDAPDKTLIFSENTLLLNSRA